MKLKNETSGDRLYKIFIYLVLSILAVLILVPVLWVMVASVKETTEHYGSPWALPTHIHWQNFADAWTKANMGGYMLHSVTITVMALGILLVVALPASYCLARFKFVGQKFLNTCFMAGLFINVNYIVVPIYLMLSDGDKWLKNILGNGFLLNNHVVVAVVYAATALPFTIYLLSSYFQTVPHDFEEAAYIDGSSYIKTFMTIILPLSKALLGVMVLYFAVGHWNAYFNAMVYTYDANIQPLQLFLRRILILEQTSADMMGAGGDEYAAKQQQIAALIKYAVIVVSSLPLMIIYPFLQKYFIQGVTMGSVKD